MKCEACSIESPLDACFLRTHPLLTNTQLLCPACFQRRRTRLVRLSFIVFFVVGPLSLFAAHAGGPHWPANLFLLVMFLILSVVPHELGHAIAAMLMGMNVFWIKFGLGTRRAHLYRYGVLIELGEIPLAATISCSTLNQRGYRWRQVFFILGGPIANVAISLGMIKAVGGWARVSMADWNSRVSPGVMFAIANAVTGWGSIVPDWYWCTGLPSDGAQILKLLLRPLPSVQQRRRGYFNAKAQAMSEAGDFQSIEKLLVDWRDELGESEFDRLQIVIQSSAGKSIATRGAVVERLQKCPEPSIERNWILNLIAWDDLILGSSDLLPEADRFSAEAYALAPWSAAIQNTRGWALAEVGQFDEGFVLLQKSLKGVIFRHDRASVLCTLAIAEVRRGRYEQAREYQRHARRLDADCGLLPRVVKELEGSQQVA
jgi:hypothetical protein